MKKKNNTPISLSVGVVLIYLGLILYAVSFILYATKAGDWAIPSSLAICFSTIGIVFYANRKKNEPKPDNKPEKKEIEPELKEKFDRIIEYVKEKGSAVSYHIEEITKDEPVRLIDSKFGGYPYWTADKEYPVDASGEKMYLLAQINFEQMAPSDNLLPKSGILQFFVKDDDLCGANFEDPTNQSNFRVIYHSEIGEPLSIEQLRELGVSANTDWDFDESMLPSVCEDAITFTKTVDYISADTDEFEEYAKEAMSELYGWSLGGTLYRELDYAEHDYLTKPFSTFGHKMLGFPAFTQNDPRIKEEEIPEGKEANTVEHYNTLLFQMDSIGNVMWGDSGVANFFINSEDLKNLDFSDVLYNWDCY